MKKQVLGIGYQVPKNRCRVSGARCQPEMWLLTDPTRHLISDTDT
jgi:hypothetical protein